MLELLIGIGRKIQTGLKTELLVPYIRVGSAISNRREPRSCLDQVFNSKLGHVGILHGKSMAYIQSLRHLKTLPRFCPVSLSLFMTRGIEPDQASSP